LFAGACIANAMIWLRGKAMFCTRKTEICKTEMESANSVQLRGGLTVHSSEGNSPVALPAHFEKLHRRQRNLDGWEDLGEKSQKQRMMMRKLEKAMRDAERL
jgi:hypothetical protein